MPQPHCFLLTLAALSAAALPPLISSPSSSIILPPLFPVVVLDVPGRPPSLHFTAEVFYAGSWTPVYVFETTAQAEIKSPSNGYFSHLEGWTHSWVSSQLAGAPLQLRVRRAAGAAPIARASVHPASSGAVISSISSAGVVISIDRPGRLAVDFDGAMDETDTGPTYAGPPLHTFSWFVDPSPAAGSLPDPEAPQTIVVRPGDAWPAPASAGATVVFAPGVHRAAAPWSAPRNWSVYNLSAETRYFLCAGAVVHSALHAGGGAWGQSGVIVDGFGVLSGEEMTRADAPDNDSPQGVVYSGVRNSSLLGVTLVDFPNHHIILGQFPDDVLRNVKVLGWRSNGDGVHVFGSWTVSDLFLRTQDDALYLTCGGGCNATFSRITTWNDANGVAFLFSPGGGDAEAVVLRDSDAIYSRTSWFWWGPNTAFVNRGDAAGQAMSGVRIVNVRVEDRRPAFNPFRIELLAPAAGATFNDVVFENISVANFSVIRRGFPAPVPLPYGIPNTIFAAAPARIFNLAFNNVSIAGLPMRELVCNPAIFNLSEGLTNVTVDGEPIGCSR